MSKPMLLIKINSLDTTPSEAEKNLIREMYEWERQSRESRIHWMKQKEQVDE